MSTESRDPPEGENELCPKCGSPLIKLYANLDDRQYIRGRECSRCDYAEGDI